MWLLIGGRSGVLPMQGRHSTPFHKQSNKKRDLFGGLKELVYICTLENIKHNNRQYEGLFI